MGVERFSAVTPTPVSREKGGIASRADPGYERLMTNNRSWFPASLFVAFTAVLGGLAGAAEPAAGPADKAGKAEATDKVVGPPEVAWKDMSADQRAHYMKAVVTPKMLTGFQAFDSEKFKKF